MCINMFGWSRSIDWTDGWIGWCWIWYVYIYMYTHIAVCSKNNSYKSETICVFYVFSVFYQCFILTKYTVPIFILGSCWLSLSWCHSWHQETIGDALSLHDRGAVQKLDGGSGGHRRVRSSALPWDGCRGVVERPFLMGVFEENAECFVGTCWNTAGLLMKWGTVCRFSEVWHDIKVKEVKILDDLDAWDDSRS